MMVSARGRKQLCRRGGRGLVTVTGMHRRRAPSSPLLGRDRHETKRAKLFSKQTISRFSDQISRSSCLLKNHSCLFDISSKPRSWLPRGPERVQRRGARGGCRLRHNRKAAGRACMTRAEKKTRFLTAVHFPSPQTPVWRPGGISRGAGAVAEQASALEFQLLAWAHSSGMTSQGFRVLCWSSAAFPVLCSYPTGLAMPRHHGAGQRLQSTSSCHSVGPLSA
jgi:hypothetical protein